VIVIATMVADLGTMKMTSSQISAGSTLIGPAKRAGFAHRSSIRGGDINDTITVLRDCCKYLCILEALEAVLIANCAAASFRINISQP
jgi:hypothetical protein